MHWTTTARLLLFWRGWQNRKKTKTNKLEIIEESSSKMRIMKIIMLLLWPCWSRHPIHRKITGKCLLPWEPHSSHPCWHHIIQTIPWHQHWLVIHPFPVFGKIGEIKKIQQLWKAKTFNVNDNKNSLHFIVLSLGLIIFGNRKTHTLAHRQPPIHHCGQPYTPYLSLPGALARWFFWLSISSRTPIPPGLMALLASPATQHGNSIHLTTRGNQTSPFNYQHTRWCPVHVSVGTTHTIYH